MVGLVLFAKFIHCNIRSIEANLPNQAYSISVVITIKALQMNAECVWSSAEALFSD